MDKNYDFSGWATRNDILCSDGRTIRKNAFKHCDGQSVPLVWNHQHTSPNDVVGHALLENRDEGVYAYGYFNDTEEGATAKALVQHKDIVGLSIYANKLTQKGGNVLHGTIREVSLVHAGANPGAYICDVVEHSDESEDGSEVIIFSGDEISLEHADSEDSEDGEKTVQEVFDTFTEEQKNAVAMLIDEVVKMYKEPEVLHADSANSDAEELAKNPEFIADVKRLFGNMSEDEQAILMDVLDDIQDHPEDYEIDTESEEIDMKHNVFDDATTLVDENVISHSEVEAAIKDAHRIGSMKEAFIQHGIDDIDYLSHTQSYGIENVSYLFPDGYKGFTNEPEFLTREMGWVAKLMNAVHRTPFSRVKTMYANMTVETARAHGYIKGTEKIDQVFPILKRTTDATTIYKKQKIDRDDVIDITDFNVISYIKREMQFMLKEEIARAILIGDGRVYGTDDDKINETHVRPVWTDDEHYTIKTTLNVDEDATPAEEAAEFIDECVRVRTQYKGSGNPTMFAPQTMINKCILLKDLNGHRLYKDIGELATAMMVKEIIPVEIMENQTRTDDGDTKELLALIFNPSDYNVGCDKGGEVNTFEDFDINFNAQLYLIETRISGALMKPYSAIAVEKLVTAED